MEVWFTNRGTPGGGKAVLTEDEARRAVEVFGEVMSEFGYTEPGSNSGDRASGG